MIDYINTSNKHRNLYRGVRVGKSVGGASLKKLNDCNFVQFSVVILLHKSVRYIEQYMHSYRYSYMYVSTSVFSV